MMEEARFKEALAALGKRIKKIRVGKGLKQKNIEEESDISRSDISKIENGLKNIELITIVKIADALGVEVYELFVPDAHPFS